MVIIIKKLVPVFNGKSGVNKKYLNLRKAVHVTSFKYLNPSIPAILVKDYGLNPEEKIVVFWTKEIRRPGFARYRLPFKKVFSGKLSEFEKHMDRIRRRGRHADSKASDRYGPQRDADTHAPRSAADI